MLRFLIYFALGGLFAWKLNPSSFINWLQFAGGFGLGIAFWAEIFLAWFRGKAPTGRKHLSGASLAETAEIVAEMKAFKPKNPNLPVGSNYSLGEVPVPIALEPSHTLIAGTTGSGKSNLFKQIMLGVRRPGLKNKGFVIDIGGSLLSIFSRPGDFILNPRDARSVSWSPLGEIKKASDCELIAKAFIPDNDSPEAKVWNSSAQTLFTSILLRIWENSGTNADLVKAVHLMAPPDLLDLVEGLPGEGVLRGMADRTAGSVLISMRPLLIFLFELDPEGNANSFSVRDWIANEDETGWLFLNFSDEMILSSLKPMITTIAGIAAAKALSIPENENRRIYWILDEMDSLGRINGLAELVKRGRRYGTAVYAAMQSISDMHASYGEIETAKIQANLGNQIILRLPDHKTAEWGSQIFDEERFLEERVSESTSSSGNSTTTSEQLGRERIVSTAALKSLPNNRGYLNIAGETRPCEIQVQTDSDRKQKLVKICEGIIEKGIKK